MSATTESIRRATLQAFKALQALDAAGLDELVRLYGDTAKSLQAAINQAAGADGTVALERLHNLLAQIETRLSAMVAQRDEILSEGLSKAASYGARAWMASGVLDAAATPRVAHEAVAFVQAFRAADGLNLSDRLWRIDRGANEAVGLAVERAVILGQDAARAAREFLSRGAAVPGEVQANLAAANGLAIGKEAARYLVGKDDAGGALYQSMRVFRTEINRAHGEAYMNKEVEARSWFGGWRFLLSPEHPETDICDLLADQNLFGLGKGVYPNREACPWPAHPNTLSYVETVFKDGITEADRAGRETVSAALSRLPEKERAQIARRMEREAAAVA